MPASTALVWPMLALMGLTLLVWCYLYVLRLGYLFRLQIDPQQLATPQGLAATLPDRINAPSNNFRNLFELPVLFYALCLIHLQLQQIDAVTVQLAWSYVALRGLHSLIHCSVNIVKYRFIAYLLSSLVLWGMLARLAWTLAS